MPEIEVLRPGEYEVLEPNLAAEIPKTEYVVVGVAFDDNGKIVARTYIVVEARFERPWVAPEWETSDILLKLERELAAAARAALGISAIYTLTNDPDTERFLEHSGYEKQPLNIWRKPISEV